MTTKITVTDDKGKTHFFFASFENGIPEARKKDDGTLEIWETHRGADREVFNRVRVFPAGSKHKEE